MNPNENFRRTGERIEKLLDELRAMAEPSTWPRVEELMRLVVELYGAGLARFVDLLDADLSIDKLRERVLEDQLLASLMLLHGLHPEDTAARVARRSGSRAALSWIARRRRGGGGRGRDGRRGEAPAGRNLRRMSVVSFDGEAHR